MAANPLPRSKTPARPLSSHSPPTIRLGPAGRSGSRNRFQTSKASSANLACAILTALLSSREQDQIDAVCRSRSARLPRARHAQTEPPQGKLERDRAVAQAFLGDERSVTGVVTVNLVRLAERL